MGILYILPLSVSTWLTDNPIIMLILGILWLILLVFLIKWIIKIGLIALLFIITFFLPFDFFYED